MKENVRQIIERININSAGWYLSGDLKEWLSSLKNTDNNVVRNEVVLQREIDNLYQSMRCRYRFLNEFREIKKRFREMIKILVNEFLIKEAGEITFGNVQSVVIASLYQSSTLLSGMKEKGGSL